MSYNGYPGAASGGDFAHPAIRRVSVEESGRWLAAAWTDILRSPLISLGYGLAFTAVSLLLFFGLNYAGLGSMVLPLAGGFMLVGPLAAMGLYEVSRRHETDEPVDLSVLAAFRRNGSQIGIMGVVLLLIMFVWTELAILIFAFFFHAAPPALDNFVIDILTSTASLPFLLVGTLVGGVLAALAFTVSAVSLPMLIDRDVSAVTAMATSIDAVRANWRVMIGWAALIALITGAGIATFFIGLVLALPLVGYASWHAYRAMVP